MLGLTFLDEPVVRLLTGADQLVVLGLPLADQPVVGLLAGALQLGAALVGLGHGACPVAVALLDEPGLGALALGDVLVVQALGQGDDRARVLPVAGPLLTGAAVLHSRHRVHVPVPRGAQLVALALGARHLLLRRRETLLGGRPGLPALLELTTQRLHVRVGRPRVGRDGVGSLRCPRVLLRLALGSALHGAHRASAGAAVLEVGAQAVVLGDEPPQLDHDLVEEVVDLGLVVAATQVRRAEALLDDVLGGQRHVSPHVCRERPPPRLGAGPGGDVLVCTLSSEHSNAPSEPGQVRGGQRSEAAEGTEYTLRRAATAPGCDRCRQR